jgi:hypothetical protein
MDGPCGTMEKLRRRHSVVFYSWSDSMPTQISQGRKGFFYVATLLVSLLVSFLVIEIGFRVALAFQVGPRILFYGTPFHWKKVPAAAPAGSPVRIRGNIQEGYTKYFPNESKVHRDPVTGEWFKVSINKRGFRGGEINEAKKPGVTRIITLGASSTFGYFDRDDETYPYYLEQKLNEDPGDFGRFEVINLGIPHLRSEQILALFYAEAISLQPDVVTFYEGSNDAYRGNPSENMSQSENTTQNQKQPPITPLEIAYRFIRSHLITVAFIHDIIAEPTFNRRRVERHMTGTSEHFIGNIDRLYQECQRRGIIFVALKQQAKSLMVKEEDVRSVTYMQEAQMVKDKLEKEGSIKMTELHFLTHSLLTTNLENWATSNHVPFVDVQKLLDQDRDVLVSWVHLSPRGNRMIADALGKEIKQLVGRQVVRLP